MKVKTIAFLLKLLGIMMLVFSVLLIGLITYNLELWKFIVGLIGIFVGSIGAFISVLTHVLEKEKTG